MDRHGVLHFQLVLPEFVSCKGTGRRHTGLLEMEVSVLSFLPKGKPGVLNMGVRRKRFTISTKVWCFVKEKRVGITLPFLLISGSGECPKTQETISTPCVGVRKLSSTVIPYREDLLLYKSTPTHRPNSFQSLPSRRLSILSEVSSWVDFPSPSKWHIWSLSRVLTLRCLDRDSRPK